MTINKEKLTKLIDDNLDVVYTNKDRDSLVKVVNEITKLFTPSTVKEKLYKEIIKRELKDKYEEGRYGTQCKTCGTCGIIEEGVLIHKHYRRCLTGQMERVLNL